MRRIYYAQCRHSYESLQWFKYWWHISFSFLLLRLVKIHVTYIRDTTICVKQIGTDNQISHPNNAFGSLSTERNLLSNDAVKNWLCGSNAVIWQREKPIITRIRNSVGTFRTFASSFLSLSYSKQLRIKPFVHFTVTIPNSKGIHFRLERDFRQRYEWLKNDHVSLS